MVPHKISAVIICYNPDIIRLIDNVFSVYKQIMSLLLIDNNSVNYEEYSNHIRNLLPSDFKLDIIRNKSNFGIARSLNIAIDYCLQNNYTWLLTLDQDSVCDLTMIEQLFDKEISRKVGLLAPKIIDINNPKTRILNLKAPITHITSGSVINIEIAKSVGGFDGKLFIDYVDHEFCLKLLVKGYDLHYSPDALLFQEIGKTSMHNFFGKKVYTTNHLPFRLYFQFRNRTYVNKKYFFHFPLWVFKDILKEIQSILLIMIYEKNKLSKLNCIIRGIFHGTFNIFDSELSS